MRIPVVLQSDRSECGLACLAMVAGSYGHHATLREFRSKFHHSSRGITLARLRECAEHIGLRCRAVRAELEEIDQLRAPAILHWELDHFVVLQSSGRRRITIIDPAIGQRKLTHAEVNEKFTGVAMELIPTPSFSKKEEAESVPLRGFFSSFRGLGRPLSATFAMTLAIQLFALAAPLQMQFTIDQGIRQGDMNLVMVIVLGFAMLGAIASLTGYFRSLLLLYIGNTSAFRMVGGLAHHLMRLPDGWFEARHTGDVLSRFSSLSPIRRFLTTGAFAMVLDGVLALGAFAMLLFYSVELTLVACGFLLVSGIISAATIEPMRNLTNESIVAGALENSSFIENAQRHRAIRLMGAEDDRGEAWGERYVASINASTRLSRFGIHLGLVGSFLGIARGVTMLLLSAGKVVSGDFTLGMLFAFTAYRGMFAGRVNGLIGAFVGLRMLKLHRERVGEISLEEPEIEDLGSGIRAELRGRVEFRAVDFSYGKDEEPVLKNFSLTVRGGEFVAITGPSGTGKSTVIKLLCKLIEPVDGQILVDGIDLRRLDTVNFRRQLGVVMQDDDLFSGSLVENIAVGESNPDMEKAERAAQLAGIHDDIAKMPMGYLTLVGHMGASLSGGQRQRLMIARAIYRDPAVILLDEGTAHLDDDLQQRVLKNLCSFGSTIIWVTHDDRVSKRADRCVDLTECFRPTQE